jgi:hypothetical protein
MDMIARDPALLRAYEQYEKAASDYTSGVNGARREGEQNKAIAVAKKALAKGATVEYIADITDLDVDTIRQLI